MKINKIDNILENVSIISLGLSLLLFLNNNLIPKSLYLFSLSAIIMIFLMIKNLVKIKKLILKKELLFFIVFLFFLLACLLFNYSIDSLKYIIYYFYGIIYMLYFVNHPGSVAKVLKIYYIGSLIFCFFTIFSYFFEETYFKIIYFLYHGTTNYQNVVNLYSWKAYSGIAGQTGYNGFTLSIGILISFILICDLYKNNKKLSKKHVIILVLQLFALFLCSKRALLLFLVITLFGLTFSFFSLKDKKVLKKCAKIMLIILVSGVAAILLFEPLRYVFIKNAELISDGRFLNGRGELYLKAIELFFENPIIGIGTKTFSHLNALNFDVHNVYLQVLAENGIIGFLILIPSMFYLLVITKRIINKYSVKHKLDKIIYISYGIQFFFILYSFTGNTIYDFNMFYLYLIIATVPVTYDVIPFLKTKERVGIITFHRAENYGAILQTYALYKKIQKYEKDVRVIDYRSKVIEKPYSLLFSGDKGDKITFRVYCFLKSLVLLVQNIKRKRNFDSFINNNLYLTEPIHNIEQLKAHLNQIKYAITGSDQVWNLEITKSDADIYLLNVGEDVKCLKNSYAASIGADEKNEEFYEKIITSTSDYKMVSVREENAKSNLIEFGAKNVELCVDPVLLHNSLFWDEIRISANISQKYLFVYTITNNADMVNFASKIAKEKGLLIVHVDKKGRYTEKCLSKYSSSPNEFVDLIANAEYVLTNSFHGLAFSIIYHKKFMMFPTKKRNSRIENLLKITHLQNRMYNSKTVINDIYTDIDYSKVNDVLAEETSKAKNYIKRILQKED